jgi:hypothetical protein
VKEILGAVASCFAALRVSSRPLGNFEGRTGAGATPTWRSAP